MSVLRRGDGARNADGRIEKGSGNTVGNVQIQAQRDAVSDRCVRIADAVFGVVTVRQFQRDFQISPVGGICAGCFQIAGAGGKISPLTHGVRPAFEPDGVPADRGDLHFIHLFSVGERICSAETFAESVFRIRPAFPPDGRPLAGTFVVCIDHRAAAGHRSAIGGERQRDGDVVGLG